MNKIICVYHGSSQIIQQPVIGKGNPNNDYGLGFYCTESVELAKEWACSAEADGFANRYAFDLNGLSILSLTGGNYHILNWLYVLLNNRKFRIGGAVARQAKQYIDEHFAVEYKQYDVIKGYRADDSYFSFASAFLNNTISLQQLEKAMLLGKLGEQIVAMSGKAFARFTFEEAIPAPCDMYYPKKLARDSKAREDFAKEKDRETVLSEKYVLDIIREEWGNEDELYLDDAMANLGDMVEYAVCTLGYAPDDFFGWFISSGIASKFENGNPKYVAGMSGVELADAVLAAVNMQSERRHQPYLSSKGREYWAGWILAYYQWETNRRFSDMVEYGLTLSVVMSLYILHEADVSKFVESADEIIQRNKDSRKSKLQLIRKARGLTQQQLSEASGVSLRMIQLYEQKQYELAKAQAGIVLDLAKVLGCDAADLIQG